MRRGIVSLGMLGILMVLVATPALGQETVFGVVDGAGGDCGGPGTPCNSGSGIIGVFGWALADTGVKWVIIQVDGIDLGQAAYGVVRPGVTDAFPGYPNSALPGWSYNINSTLFENGMHAVSAKVVSLGGTTEVVHSKDILFTNNTSILRPFGKIETPGRNEDVFGTCQRFTFSNDVCEAGLGENCLNSPGDCFEDVDNGVCCGVGSLTDPVGCDAAGCNGIGFQCNNDDKIRYTVISGYALDLGVSEEDTGVRWIELETNEAIVGNTRTSCVFDRSRGGLTNCYGLPRLDVEGLFPFVLDAPSSGFRFALDVGGFIISDLAPRGHNTLTARAGDFSNQSEDIDSVVLNFLCAEEWSEPSFGRIESPREGRLYTGLLTFQGWALDGEGVDRIEIYIDGKLIPGTLYGPGLGTRTLVAAEYPGFENTEAPVWRLADYDTSLIVDGFHQLQVRVIDDEGDSTFIGGEITFRTENVVD